jgi:secondary thiamine-phosphate synthase enzyme
VLVGNDVSLSVHEGELVLGTWQGVYFAEFDGPRERSATVTVIGD